MAFGKQEKEINLKLNQLRLLESRLDNLLTQCQTILETVKDKEKNIKKMEIEFQKQIAEKETEIKNTENFLITTIENAKANLTEKDINLNNQIERKKQEIYILECGLRKTFEEKSKGFPWLSEAIAELLHLHDIEVAEYLEFKSHPAPKKAEQVLKISADNKELRKKFKIAENFVNYYETLFPWIADYRVESLSDLLEEIEKEKKDVSQDQDPVLRFVPKGEYKKLSEEERNQKALDRYMGFGKKSFWRLGRDYERYIGYLYEKRGYKVSYEGII